MISLTPKQALLLGYIRGFQSKHGYSPSMQEMAKEFKKSINSIKFGVDQLRKKKYITYHEDVARGIELLETGEE